MFYSFLLFLLLLRFLLVLLLHVFFCLLLLLLLPSSLCSLRVVQPPATNHQVVVRWHIPWIFATLFVILLLLLHLLPAFFPPGFGQSVAGAWFAAVRLAESFGCGGSWRPL